MDINLVSEGLKFMVLGMTTVFLFLILMVFVLKIQSLVLEKFFLKPQASSENLHVEDKNDTQLIAVISAAITQYKKQKKDTNG